MAGRRKVRPPRLDRPRKTLERVLSRAGACTRAEARERILAGRVCVNGRVVRQPETWVDEERDEPTLDGVAVVRAATLCIAFHKPAGCVTTRRDPEGRPTVYDWLRDAPGHVLAIGRLDFDTRGLLLFTNDTALAERITSPASKLDKVYELRTPKRLSDAQLERLRSGVELSDGHTRSARAERLREPGRTRWIRLAISEGRNRQVRRMLLAVGSEVKELRRTAVGPILLGDLPEGRWRALDARELSELWSGSATRRAT